MNKKKNDKKRSVLDIVFLFVFICGLFMFLYPTISDLWNGYRQRQLSAEYTSALSGLSDRDYSAWFEEAEAYNASHQHLALDDLYDSNGGSTLYREYLNPNNSDVMGYVNIPKIGQRLMIYYGTGEEGLSRGVGHMEGSSLPVGGESTHAVLAGHRGLPSARLFTDLDQLEIGDLFTVTVLDRTFAYRVDQIEVIDPEEVDAVEIVPGKDYVTLLTCTPYGVNTQRLLVRGERTELSEDVMQELEAQQASHISPVQLAMLAAAVLVTGLFVWSLVLAGKKKKDHSSDSSTIS